MEIYNVMRRGKDLIFDKTYGVWRTKDVDSLVASFENVDDANEFISKSPSKLYLQTREVVLHKDFDANEDFGVVSRPFSGAPSHNLSDDEYSRLSAALSPVGATDEDFCLKIARMENLKQVQIEDEKTVSGMEDGTSVSSAMIMFDNDIIARVSRIYDFYDSRYEISILVNDNGYYETEGSKIVIPFSDVVEGQTISTILEHVSTREFAETSEVMLQKERDFCTRYEEIPDLKKLLSESAHFYEDNEALNIKFHSGLVASISKNSIPDLNAAPGERVFQYDVKVFVSEVEAEREIPNMGLSFKISEYPDEIEYTRTYQNEFTLQEYLETLSKTRISSLHLDEQSHCVDTESLPKNLKLFESMIEAHIGELSNTSEAELSLQERYSMLFTLDKSGKLAEIVDQSALSYEENSNDMRIVFENGNGIYIGEDRIIPYHTVDEKEEVLTLRAMKISEMSAEDIVGVLKSVEGGEIQISSAREADMLRESPVTLDERIQNGKFIDSAERIFGEDTVKLYSFMRDHELGGIGDVDSLGHSISVVLHDEGQYGTCELLQANNYGGAFSVSRVVWDDPQDHPANAPSVPGHTVFHGTQEEAVDKLDKILTHFQQVYAEENAKIAENTSANRYEEIANATGISLIEVTNNSAFFDKAYELLGDRAGVAYLFMLDNEKDAAVTVEGDKMIIDVKTDDGKGFIKDEHVTVIFDSSRVSVDYDETKSFYLADVSNSNTAFSIARDMLTEHDLKINGHARSLEKLEMLEHQKDYLSQKELLFEIGKVFSEMNGRDFTRNECAAFVETFDKLGIPTYSEFAAQRSAKGASVDGKMLGELIRDGDEAAILHIVQQFRYGSESVNVGAGYSFGEDGSAAQTLRNAIEKEMEENIDRDNVNSRDDDHSSSLEM